MKARFTILLVLFSLLAASQQKKRKEAGEPETPLTLKDSAIVPGSRIPQFSEFINGTYNFPAKPRHQWEMGLKGGIFQVSGDIPAQFLSPGLGFHIRKSFGYIFSMRVEYLYAHGKGQAFKTTQNFYKNTALFHAGYYAPRIRGDGMVEYRSALGTSLAADDVFYNYKTQVHDLSVQGLITLNNIRFHKARTGIVVYGLAGIGATVYHTAINALNDRDGNKKYDYAGLESSSYRDRKAKRNQLKSFLDRSYESEAENQGERRPKLFGHTFKPSGTAGVGIEFKLTSRINLALEDRWTIIKDDLLDGQRWQESAWGDAVQTRDFDAYNFLSLGININIGEKAVQPLYWINPLNYAYSEIREPKQMRIRTGCPPDSDGDGIMDLYDMEQTLPGCPVDFRGVSLDTDADGVPDCKDHQLITPTYCQPVNEKGIGVCPLDPDCCKIFHGIIDPGCEELFEKLPSIIFKEKSSSLTKEAMAGLDTVARKMTYNPGCAVMLTVFCSPGKRKQQIGSDRANAVINYLAGEKGISRDRFLFDYVQGGNCNNIGLRGASDADGQ